MHLRTLHGRPGFHFDLEDEGADLTNPYKPLDKGTGATELHERTQKHRAALVEVRGDVQRVNERIDKMVPEARELLRKAQSEATMVYAGAGDNSRLQRFALPDGGIQFGTVTVPLLDVDGTRVGEETSRGLLTSDAVSPEHDRVLDAYRDFVTADALVRKYGSSARRLRARTWHSLLTSLDQLPGPVGRTAARILRDSGERQRAVNATSATGGYAINTPLISDIRVPKTLMRRLAGLVPSIDAQSSSFKQLSLTGHTLMRVRSASQDEVAYNRLSTPVFAQTQIDMFAMQATVKIDPLWLTDQGNVINGMESIQGYLDQSEGDTMEAVLLHADSNGQDTLSSWTLGSYFTAGALDGSDSPLKQTIGLRARAFDDSNTTDAGSTWGIDDNATALGLLGSWASGSVVAMGLKCYYGQLVGSTVFSSWQQIGPAATLITGQVGSIGDIPIIISEFLAAEYASTGLYTGSGALNTMVHFHPAAWRWARMSSSDSDFSADRPEMSSVFVGRQRRLQLYPNIVSGEKPCSVIKNLT